MSYDDLDHIPFDNPRRKSSFVPNNDEYTHDRDGNRVYAGDYVQNLVTGYMNFKVGERRRVVKISMDTLIMHNGASPRGTSAYNPKNFRLAGRHHAWHKTQEAQVAKNTLYVAILTDSDYEALATQINDAHKLRQPPVTHADTSFESLKAWLNQRIRANPDERWLILSGTVLAETSAPPVSFRSL